MKKLKRKEVLRQVDEYWMMEDRNANRYLFQLVILLLLDIRDNLYWGLAGVGLTLIGISLILS